MKMMILNVIKNVGITYFRIVAGYLMKVLKIKEVYSVYQMKQKETGHINKNNIDNLIKDNGYDIEHDLNKILEVGLMIQYKRFDIAEDDKKDKNTDKMNKFLQDCGHLMTTKVTVIQPHYESIEGKEKFIPATHVHHIWYKIPTSNGKD
jgi:hypothetical protein